MTILLKKPFFNSITTKELVEQIESKKRCKKKLPTWFATPKIYYPKKINIEQTSSELTAKYKSQLISGKSLIDLTGGLGVDSYFFSQKTRAVSYLEIDPELVDIASHNFQILGAKNIEVILGDGLEFLKAQNKRFDWLFIDPSRRSEKGKVFHLSDCLPDVTKNFDLFFSCADNLLIKTAPFLDISAGIKDLQNVKEIHVVAVNGEVKELLWMLEKGFSGEIQVKTINILKQASQSFTFMLDAEKEAISSFHIPLDYLYEPNAAILKSGGFKIVGNRLSLMKIHQHTHLYTSEQLLEFPGRRFRIKECLTLDKKTRQYLKGIKANVTTRNFPETVAEIKKKHKIKDGGTTYLFFVTDLNDKLVVLNCEKVNKT